MHAKPLHTAYCIQTNRKPTNEDEFEIRKRIPENLKDLKKRKMYTRFISLEADFVCNRDASFTHNNQHIHDKPHSSRTTSASQRHQVHMLHEKA